MASILITGASRGIGMATALVLARSGHTVFATMRDPARGREFIDTTEKENLQIHFLAMDVTSDESVTKTIDAIQSKYGPIDVLVNNAGIGHAGAVEEINLSIFREVMETNYFGALRCIQAVLPQMRERRKGCIVNVTSLSGRIASSPFAPYAASKHALEALTEALAQEVKPFNVRVAIVEPGIIDTSMARRSAERQSDSIYPQTRRMAGLFAASLRRPVPPSLVAEKILEIVQTDSWTLRYPVGADAQAYLKWRASMTDEQWIDWNATDDDTWYQSVQHTFGLNAR